MKPELDFLGSRDLKHFFGLIEKQYGRVPLFFEKSAFVRRNEKIALVSRDVEQVLNNNLRINSAGLYIAEVKDDQLRLSIEGSQLIGPTATKNVCEIDAEQTKQWFKGSDLKVSGEFDGFVIIKSSKDFIGSGKFKEGFILNFVPKARRLIDVH